MTVLPAAAAPGPLPDETCPSFYSGRVEPNLDMQLFLTRDGNAVEGTARYAYDEVPVRGAVDPRTGALTLTEFVAAREGRESSGGRFTGRIDGDGIKGVWENRTGRISRKFSLRPGGDIQVGGNPGYRLHLEPSAGGDGNLGGWLLIGGEAFDLGDGCVHQSSAAMNGPEFENLEVEILPGRPELVHTALEVASANGARSWLHSLYAPGSQRPLLQIEGGRENTAEGARSTTFDFAYQGADLIMKRLDDEYGAVGAAGAGGRLAPACVEATREQLFRFQLAPLDGNLTLVPQSDGADFGGETAEARIFSPACDGDPAPEEETGPAAVIRDDRGLVSLVVNPDPENASYEAVCWIAGQARHGQPNFAVPPPALVRKSLAGAVPLTIRWPEAGKPRAVAVFLDPGEDGPEPGNGDLLALYDRETHTCYHRLYKEGGDWGEPVDEAVFRQRFGP